MANFESIDFANNEKYVLYKVEERIIDEVDNKIKLPSELIEFYKKVGYGFINKTDNNSINRILSPLQLLKINLKEDYYSSDPDLEIFETDFYIDKFIFYEVNEGVYLLIDKNEKIADSLEAFLLKFKIEGYYFE